MVFKVTGEDAWTRLEHEGGVHRVQRVPVTEAKGRIHTSSATVTVLPEAEEVDVEIDANDLKVDVYRSSGPGGQSVNTTDSAVRVTHLPTGIVVSMQDEKSQLQNRAKALVVLRSRLLKRAQDEEAAEARATCGARQVGGGGRGEKIRTYNFKENRVTDHRINLTLYKLDAVMAGDLDDFVDALIADKRSPPARRGPWRLTASSTSSPRASGRAGRPRGCSRSSSTWTLARRRAVALELASRRASRASRSSTCSATGRSAASTC